MRVNEVLAEAKVVGGRSLTRALTYLERRSQGQLSLLMHREREMEGGAYVAGGMAHQICLDFTLTVRKSRKRSGE